MSGPAPDGSGNILRDLLCAGGLVEADEPQAVQLRELANGSIEVGDIRLVVLQGPPVQRLACELAHAATQDCSQSIKCFMVTCHARACRPGAHLRVMDLHCPRVDVRLQRGVVIRQRRELVCHGARTSFACRSLGLFSKRNTGPPRRKQPCRTALPGHSAEHAQSRPQTLITQLEWFKARYDLYLLKHSV